MYFLLSLSLSLCPEILSRALWITSNYGLLRRWYLSFSVCHCNCSEAIDLERSRLSCLFSLGWFVRVFSKRRPIYVVDANHWRLGVEAPFDILQTVFTVEKLIYGFAFSSSRKHVCRACISSLTKIVDHCRGVQTTVVCSKFVKLVCRIA